MRNNCFYRLECSVGT